MPWTNESNGLVVCKGTNKWHWFESRDALVDCIFTMFPDEALESEEPDDDRLDAIIDMARIGYGWIILDREAAELWFRHNTHGVRESASFKDAITALGWYANE